MKLRTVMRIIGAVIAIVGFIVVGLAANWFAAFGLFLFVWGNNIEISSRGKEVEDGPTKE